MNKAKTIETLVFGIKNGDIEAELKSNGSGQITIDFNDFMTIVDLMNTRNLGRKSLEEILAVANSYRIKIEEGY